MSDVRLSKPRLRVIVEGDLDELVAIDIQTDNRDAVRFDLMRRLKKWPDLQEAPMLWYTVLAWSALKRAKQTPWGEFKVEEWLDDVCLDVIPIDEAGNEIKIDPATGEPVEPDAEVRAVPTSPETDSG